jgi:hypothetical protein
MENVGIFYSYWVHYAINLVYLRSVWYILWSVGIFYGQLVYFVVILVYFSPFWFVVPRKIWQPCGACT